MSTFTESGLQFHFDSNWQVKKFDDHRYYRWLSGLGMKGVDFIALNETGDLFLIEVKNYQWRNEWQSPKHLMPDSLKLSTAFIEKINDSIQVVQTIMTFIERRWWYRPAQLVAPYLTAHRVWKWDWYFWQNVHHILKNKTNKVNLILWLEEAKAITAFSGSIHAQLEKAIKAQMTQTAMSIQVVNRNTHTLKKLNVHKVTTNPKDNRKP